MTRTTPELLQSEMSVMWNSAVTQLTDCDPDQVLYLLNKVVFPKLADSANLTEHKDLILSYFRDNTIDGDHLVTIGKKRFVAEVIAHCDGNMALNNPSSKLYKALRELTIDALSQSEATQDEDSKEVVEEQQSLWDREAKVADCNHTQIMLIADAVITKNEKAEQHRDALLAFLRDRRIDGKTMAGYKKKQFCGDVVTHAENKKLRGISGKFWRLMTEFDLYAIRDSQTVDASLDDGALSRLDSSESVLAESTLNQGKMSWTKIANCVDHEMYIKLGSTLRAIVKSTKNKITDGDLTDASINKMMEILEKKRKLAIEERQYLHRLIYRAQRADDHGYNQDVDDGEDFEEGTDSEARTDSEEDAGADDADLPDVDNQSVSHDYHSAYDGLNHTMMQDIFDVHRAFRFSNYHFEEYTEERFRADIRKAGDDFLVKNFSVRQFREGMNFHPQYVIHDDMFEIFDYIFSASQYAHDLQVESFDDSRQLRLVVIPNAIKSVYDESDVFQYSFDRLDDYLFETVGDTFDKIILRTQGDHDVSRWLQSLHHGKESSRALIIIDRRRLYCQYDILYMSKDNVPPLAALDDTYRISFDFQINPDAVSAYFSFGRAERLRFYPELLTSIIPRLFKRTQGASDAEQLDKLYSHQFKHGWSVMLRDERFEKYYKLMTGTDHVSVNYNRIKLCTEYSSSKNIIFFRDLLNYELIAHKASECATVLLGEFCVAHDYDSESIIDDVLSDSDRSSNLQAHFASKERNADFDKILRIVRKYTDPTQEEKLKICHAANVLTPKKCGDLRYVVRALQQFEQDGFDVNVDGYDISTLLPAYDHVVAVHELCCHDTGLNAIQKYIQSEVGHCTLDDCAILSRHISRRRERDRNVPRTEPDNGEDSVKEIISATLCAMHCYVLHKERDLFRLKRADDNHLHFITPKDDEKGDEKEEQSALSVKFGVSVLEWLRYGEEPTFTSFCEEIVSNPNSTINEPLYLTFAQECFFKMLGKKREQFQLNELLSLKIYTDTNTYQSALRKASWKSSTSSTKRSFYHWARQLYSTALFHAKHIPRVGMSCAALFHGLSMVFVLDEALPVYNGQLSTSLERTVGERFSKGEGLLWKIQPQYNNKFKFIVGICVEWLSQYDNEREVLLINQHLPIVSTTNFDENIENNVDHLLESLRLYKTPITSVADFYNVIGLRRKPEWLPIIKSRRTLLYQKTAMPQRTLLERMVEELKFNIFPDEYSVLSSKLQPIIFPAFNYFALSAKTQGLNQQHLSDLSCKIVFENSETTLNYMAPNVCKRDMRGDGTVYVKNKALFGCDDHIRLQLIRETLFESASDTFHEELQLQGHLIVLRNGNTTLAAEHQAQVWKCKFIVTFLDGTLLKAEDHRIYQFANLATLHFIVPFTSTPQSLAIYVQFEDHYNFVLFKTFDIDSMGDDTATDEIAYLLSLLGYYRYPIQGSTSFFENTGLVLSEDHIEILKARDSLLGHQGMELLNVLVGQLDVTELSPLLQEQRRKMEAEYAALGDMEEMRQKMLEQQELERKLALIPKRSVRNAPSAVSSGLNKETQSLWNGEQDVSECSHAQILFIAEEFMAKHDKLLPLKEALLGYLKDKQLDGKGIVEFARKAFCDAVVEHCGNKKARGAAGKLWRFITDFDLASVPNVE